MHVDEKNVVKGMNIRLPSSSPQLLSLPVAHRIVGCTEPCLSWSDEVSARPERLAGIEFMQKKRK